MQQCCAPAFTNDSYLGVKATADVPVRKFAYADFGIDTMGDGMAANIDTFHAGQKVAAAPALGGGIDKMHAAGPSAR